jgi:hypothetical protein
MRSEDFAGLMLHHENKKAPWGCRFCGGASLTKVEPTSNVIDQ